MQENISLLSKTDKTINHFVPTKKKLTRKSPNFLEKEQKYS